MSDGSLNKPKERIGPILYKKNSVRKKTLLGQDSRHKMDSLLKQNNSEVS